MTGTWEMVVWFITPLSKNVFLSCCWKRHRVLFLIARCVLAMVIRFIASKPFSLSPPPKNTVWSFLLLVFQLQSVFFFFWFLIFILGHFVEVVFVFNFIIKSQFTKYYIFVIYSLFFWSLFFFLVLL